MKQKFKSIFLLLLSVCFFFTFSVQSLAKQEPIRYSTDLVDILDNVPVTIANEAQFNTVIQMPIGHEEGAVGYAYRQDGTAFGPQDFLIHDNGVICVLDTINKRILAFENGEYSYEIDITGATDDIWAQFFAYHNGMYYILNLLDDYIVVVSEAEPVNAFKIPLPEGHHVGDFYAMTIEENSLRLSGFLDEPGQTIHFMLPLEDVHTVTADSYIEVPAPTSTNISANQVSLTYKDSTWVIDTDSYNGIGIIGASNEGTVYINHYERVKNTSFLRSERTIRAYDSNGNILGYARIDSDNWTAFPLKDVHITENGHVFLLDCRENRVELQYVILGETYASNIHALELEVRRLESAAAMTEATVNSSGYVSPSRTTAQMREVVDAMVNHTWQIAAGNQSNRGNPYITVPEHIRNASIGDTIQGIPYCWGGFDTVSQFDTKRQNGQTTGNVNSRDENGNEINIQSGTTGVDCSGFVSRVYGLPQKLGTGSFLNFGTKKLDSVTDANSSVLSYMDFLVKNGHILIFLNCARDGSPYLYQVVDSTTTSSTFPSARIDRVRIRFELEDYVQQFQARSPQHACTYGSYTGNSTQHWRACTICGNKINIALHRFGVYEYSSTQHWQECICGQRQNQAAHTWIYYTSYYRCSICHCINTGSVPGIDSLSHEEVY